MNSQMDILVLAVHSRQSTVDRGRLSAVLQSILKLLAKERIILLICSEIPAK